MDETQKDHGVNMSCDNCGCCNYCHKNGAWGAGMGKFFILRWILGLIILFIVFMIGFKLGEFKQDLQQGYFGDEHNMRFMHFGGGLYGTTDSNGMPMQMGNGSNMPMMMGGSASGTSTAPAPKK